VREVSATCNSHSVAEADGSLVLSFVFKKKIEKFRRKKSLPFENGQILGASSRLSISPVEMPMV
jgi:hypothetical protein